MTATFGDRWDFPSGELPASLVWSAGQEVTVSVKLASPCNNLDNLYNAIVVKNLTGEITQAGQSQFHRIKLDPYRSYLIEAIGQNGEDMLGVEEHPNLTLSNPDIPAIWNAKARWITYGDRNDGDQPRNVIRRFLDSDYRTYKVEVDSGTGGTGTYQLKVRVNNICRIDDDGNAQYQWAGGPEGYPQGSDLPAGIGGRQVLLTGTDWGNDNVTRPEIHHVLGDNWDSNQDEDWIGVDLEGSELYTVRLRTKNSLPERLQATQLKILGMKDANGNDISGTESAGDAGKKVFLTDWTAPSTGRFHIAVGSEGDRPAPEPTGSAWSSKKTRTDAGPTVPAPGWEMPGFHSPPEHLEGCSHSELKGRKGLPGKHEPGDHEHRAAEKPPGLGTFPNEFQLQVCVCGARRFTDLNSEPMTDDGWFIWASRTKRSCI